MNSTPNNYFTIQYIVDSILSIENIKSKDDLDEWCAEDIIEQNYINTYKYLLLHIGPP